MGGDVITAIDDQAMGGMDDLISYLVKETRPGDEVTLTILRDGKEYFPDQSGNPKARPGRRARVG